MSSMIVELVNTLSLHFETKKYRMVNVPNDTLASARYEMVNLSVGLRENVRAGQY